MQQPEWNVTTIGYNARGSAQTLDDLMSDEQVLLIDTRLKPWSQRPEWRQEALAAKYGERYHFAGKFLGNVNYKGGEIQIADPATGLRGLRQYLSEGYRLILLCACPEYTQCHRQMIVELLCATTPGVRVMQPELPSGEDTNVYMRREWEPQEGKIPCISIQQPFASGIVEGRKSIELRTWGTSYRGIIALHAGSKWYGGVDLRKSTFRAAQHEIDAIREAVKRLGTSREVAEYPTGAIIGMARLVECRRFVSEDEYELWRNGHKGSTEWDEKEYGWWFEDVVKLPEPVKVRGYLGLFGVDREPLESTCYNGATSE